MDSCSLAQIMMSLHSVRTLHLKLYLLSVSCTWSSVESRLTHWHVCLPVCLSVCISRKPGGDFSLMDEGRDRSLQRSCLDGQDGDIKVIGGIWERELLIGEINSDLPPSVTRIHPVVVFWTSRESLLLGVRVQRAHTNTFRHTHEDAHTDTHVCYFTAYTSPVLCYVCTVSNLIKDVRRCSWLLGSVLLTRLWLCEELLDSVLRFWRETVLTQCIGFSGSHYWLSVKVLKGDSTDSV